MCSYNCHIGVLIFSLLNATTAAQHATGTEKHLKPSLNDALSLWFVKDDPYFLPRTSKNPCFACRFIFSVSVISLLLIHTHHTEVSYLGRRCTWYFECSILLQIQGISCYLLFVPNLLLFFAWERLEHIILTVGFPLLIIYLKPSRPVLNTGLK